MDPTCITQRKLKIINKTRNMNGLGPKAGQPMDDGSVLHHKSISIGIVVLLSLVGAIDGIGGLSSRPNFGQFCLSVL